MVGTWLPLWLPLCNKDMQLKNPSVIATICWLASLSLTSDGYCWPSLDWHKCLENKEQNALGRQWWKIDTSFWTGIGSHLSVLHIGSIKWHHDRWAFDSKQRLLFSSGLEKMSYCLLGAVGWFFFTHKIVLIFTYLINDLWTLKKCSLQPTHNQIYYFTFRPDQTLQELVYKLVPGLFTSEYIH